MTDRLLSIRDAAEELAVSPDLIRKLVTRGDIAALRVGKLIRIERAALDDYRQQLRDTRPVPTAHRLAALREGRMA